MFKGRYNNNEKVKKRENIVNKIDASGVKRLIPCMSFCS